MDFAEKGGRQCVIFRHSYWDSRAIPICPAANDGDAFIKNGLTVHPEFCRSVKEPGYSDRMRGFLSVSCFRPPS